MVVESAHGDPTVAWTAEDRGAVTALGLGLALDNFLIPYRPAKSSRKRFLTKKMEKKVIKIMLSIYI